jgi:hypothetical protein
MIIQIMTMFVVPVFQAIWREGAAKKMTQHAIENNPEE